MNSKTPVRLGSAMSGAGKSRTVARDISESLGKLPPQALDMEEAVLGAALLERTALLSVMDFLKSENFYSDQHKEIFRAIEELSREGKPVDMRTVVAQLRKTGKLEVSGGAFYIAELTSKVSSGANVEQHSRYIIELSIKRDLIHYASAIHHDAYEDTTDVFDLLEKAERGIAQLIPYNTRNLADSKTILAKGFKKLQEKKDHNGLTGIASGFYDMDRVSGGFQNSELILVAARPSMGKTAFILNAMLNASMNFNTRIAFFSLEMSQDQIALRIISILSETPLEDLRRSDLVGRAWEHLMQSTNKFGNAPFFMDDTSSVSIYDLKAKCRKLKDEKKIDMVVVDYLQLMSGDKNGNREQEISSISRGLKQIAKDLNVPVIALSQLSRSVETRGGDKRPMLSDLRESGSLEQDADVVSFLYRPEYYGIQQDEQGNSMQGVMEIIFAKNRQGATDNICLKFIGKYTKVTDLNAVPQNFRPVSEARKPYVDDSDKDNLPF